MRESCSDTERNNKMGIYQVLLIHPFLCMVSNLSDLVGCKHVQNTKEFLLSNETKKAHLYTCVNGLQL